MSQNNQAIGSVIRIDIPKDRSQIGTHGWQVRVPTGKPRKYHSRLFSDSRYGSSHKALAAAKKYLKAYLRQHPDVAKTIGRTYRKDRLLPHNRSGHTGVYRTYSYSGRDTGKLHRQYYWAAFCPIGPDGQRNKWFKRFYVERHGDEEARRLAIEFRKMWEEAADEGEEAIKRFFVAYEEGLL